MPSHAGAVHELWDALADFPAAQSDAALVHLMKTLCEWLRADDAFWVGGLRIGSGHAARRDPQYGWRARAVCRLNSTPVIEDNARVAAREQDTEPGMTTRALTAEAGVFRVRRLHDGFVDLTAFRRTAHYRVLYEAAGIADRMWVVFPVNPDAESYFMFDHVGSRRRFSDADTALAAHALRGIKWFHRQVLLSHGLPLAREPLSPAERKILLLLLGDRSEKDIAAQLGLTPGTAHQYVVALFRKLGVKGRAGLTATWLSR